MVPKIWVGTMYSGENEYNDSVTSISQQVGVQIERFVVKNLPEFEAAKTLYSTWSSVKENFDMFVQVDPDTILTHSNVFKDMYDLLSSKVVYTSIQCPLKDYLSNSLIYGLNGYLKSVEFNIPKSELYSDRCTSNNITYVIKEPCKLNPAGVHSPNPTPQQAFHFGVHRGLKNQQERLNLVIKANQDEPHTLRMYAIAGFKLARSDFFVNGTGFNYKDQNFQRAFEHASLHLNSLV